MAIRKKATIARRYGLAGLFALAMCCGGAAAQCTAFAAPTGIWPTQVGFTPANPIAGQPFTIDLGPATSYIVIAPTPTVTGQDIVLSPYMYWWGGVPPGPRVFNQNVSGLPAGNYQVHIRMRNDNGPCPEIVAPLLIGPAPTPTPVPTLSSPWWLAVLVAGVLSAGLGVRRRRYG